jgi:carboxylesterase 2
MASIRVFIGGLLVLCILVLSHAAPLADNAIAPSATIANGVVVGISTPVPNEPSNPGLVNSYLGIPFAKSPPLRFAPPEPALPWSTPLQATEVKPACIQQFVGPKNGKLQNNLKKVFNNPQRPPPDESEDCLYLNVFAPQNASSTNLKPVMFWIFGGNLMFGTASLEFYDGSSFAVNQDVVVVAINYRTNIFGFSNSPELPKGSQNVGFLDQRFALQWVQDNIAQFGGDPSKVLLFGESAGGYSVKQLLANPPSPLPFAGAIMQSQQALMPFNGLTEWKRAVYNLNCAEAESPLACLRSLPVNEIKESIEGNYQFFGPAQEDGTSTADVRKSIAAGKFAKVPIVMGTNSHEMRVFLSLLGLESSASAVDFAGGWLGVDASKSIGKLISDLSTSFVNNTYLALDEYVPPLTPGLLAKPPLLLWLKI